MNTEPTEKDMESPRFKAVWKAIKGWDICRSPEEGYAHATGTDVMTILSAVDKADLHGGRREHVPGFGDVIIGPEREA